MPLGFSFAPGADIQMNGDGQSGGASPARLTPQQAVKILSLRVPQSLPQNAPVARQLLTSPGGSAPGAQGLQSLIQQLMQSFKPQAGTSGPQPQPPLPSQPVNFPPTQAPTVGPPGNASQTPQFMGNIDTPPPAYQQPFFGGGGNNLNAGGGDPFRDLQILAQFSNQPSFLPRIIVDNGLQDIFGTGVAQNKNA